MLIVLSIACQKTVTAISNNDFLYRVIDENNEASCIYLNQKGDTIIDGKEYAYCFSDTIEHFGFVMTNDNICMAIDRNGKEMYQVFWYDNGPDYYSDGLFRIIKNGKIGYADETGTVIIEPQFECAEPFEAGKAKVAKKCTLVADGEYKRAESSEWFYINKAGKIVE